MQPVRSLTVLIDYDALIATSHASAQAARLTVDYRF